MTIRSILVIYSLLATSGAFFFPYPYPRVKLAATESQDAGEPLFLTPYLKKGCIEKAQNLSRVNFTMETLKIESFAGFFTVDEKYESNLFFWYFPSSSKDPEAPVILWLQGGPGGSSLYGLFTELGPIEITSAGLKVREHHWAKNYHLVFIDNPAGTGFSFTRNDAGYCTNEECIGKGLYSAMSQFFTLFPDLQENDFYITGESYAGKYVPSLGITIHRQNLCIDRKKSTNSTKINLKGMAIGNGFFDPIHQLDYGNYLYQVGLLDFRQKEFFETLQRGVVKAIKRKEWKKADLLLDKIMDGGFGNFSYFRSFTGFTNYYNYLVPIENTADDWLYADLVNNDKVRGSIHVGGLPHNSGEEVEKHLREDMLQSVAPYVKELLSHYRMMVYNGQLDIIVAYPLTDNFLRHLDYPKIANSTACRKIWRVAGEIAGYYKVMGNMTQVLVRNAGHMVPRDQPEWALDMIDRFIDERFD